MSPHLLFALSTLVTILHLMASSSIRLFVHVSFVIFAPISTAIVSFGTGFILGFYSQNARANFVSAVPVCGLPSSTSPKLVIHFAHFLYHGVVLLVSGASSLLLCLPFFLRVTVFIARTIVAHIGLIRSLAWIFVTSPTILIQHLLEALVEYGTETISAALPSSLATALGWAAENGLSLKVVTAFGIVTSVRSRLGAVRLLIPVLFVGTRAWTMATHLATLARAINALTSLLSLDLLVEVLCGAFFVYVLSAFVCRFRSILRRAFKVAANVTATCAQAGCTLVNIGAPLYSSLVSAGNSQGQVDDSYVRYAFSGLLAYLAALGERVRLSARVSSDVRTPAPSSPVPASASFESTPFYGVSYRQPRFPGSLSSTIISPVQEEIHWAALNSVDHIAQVTFDIDHDVDIIGAWLARKCGAFAGRVYPPVSISPLGPEHPEVGHDRIFIRLDLLVQPENIDLGVHYTVLIAEIVPSHESPTVFTIVEKGESRSVVRRIGLKFHGVRATENDSVLVDWQSGCATLGGFWSEEYQQLGRNVRWEKEADVFLRRHGIPEQKWVHDVLCAGWQERLGDRVADGLYASCSYDGFHPVESGERWDDEDRWDDDSAVNSPPESARSSTSLADNANAFNLDFDCVGFEYSADELASNYPSPPRTPPSDAGYPFSTTTVWPPSTPVRTARETRGFRCPTTSSTSSTTPSTPITVTPPSTPPADGLMDDPFVLESSSVWMPHAATTAA